MTHGLKGDRVRAVATARTRPWPIRRGPLAVLTTALFLAFTATATAGPPIHQQKPDPIGGFALNHACGTAADSEGNRYVSNAGNAKIEVFDPTGAHLRSIANANEPCGLAVDTHGTLFVTEKGTGKVIRYVPDHYPFVGVPTYDAREEIDASGEAQGIAVDPFDDRLFVAKGQQIDVYDSEGNLGVDEVQRVRVGPFETGGTFTLSFEGDETGPIPYNATHAEIEAELEDLAGIGVGNISVSQGGLGPRDHIVNFEAALSHTDVPTIAGDPSNLVGEKFLPITVETPGFNGRLAEDSLANYTGIAAYTYQFQGDIFTRYLYAADSGGDEVEVFSGKTLQSLKARRTISGVDENEDGEVSAAEELEFGAAGAYLAVDQGNRASNDKCASVAEQACTAGHLLVYDEAADAVEEFEASGEFLDRIESAEFADAGPTGLAIERSGGPNDGTIYATAGAGAGAKLLAFAPLVQPSRPLLPKLSHALIDAKAVAVDEYGDVYVAAGPNIKVFGPAGEELATIADPRQPYDLAVDSECNVYVLDGAQNNEAMTYFDAPSCPPATGASFTRHEPALVPPTSSLTGVAVNPADDHVFLLTFKGKQTAIEFEAAPGSAQIRECALSFDNGFDIGIDDRGEEGATLYVAMSGFDRRISTIDCGEAEGEEELITSFRGGGCPAGLLGASPKIAVDQSNGHALQFQPGAAGAHAREYDASGACVAEYGSFAEVAGVPEYAIATDNGAHSPNRGTAYIAFDGNDNTIQPYDLTAFGPLSYGAPPQVQTGIADAIGPAQATLKGTVNPSGFELESCEFEYLLDSTYEQNLDESKPGFEGAATVPCAETPVDIGLGEAPKAVHADPSDLDPSPQARRYRFRLVAENKFGPDTGNTWLFGPPRLTPKPALPVLYGEAALRAEIDPSGLATKYHFDYGPEQGTYTQSTPTVTLPPGDGAVAVKAPLTGLKEGTAYHFQVVVENEAATAKGPDQSFETQQRRGQADCPNTEYRVGLSSQLPDCRAYELVTPVDSRNSQPGAAASGSAGAIFNNWLVDPRGPGAGESVGYFAGTLPGFEGTGNTDGYRATRAPGEHPKGGWSSALHSPSFAQLGFGDTTTEGVSADQDYWLWNHEVAKYPALLPIGKLLRVPAGTASLECNLPPNTNPETFQDEFELVGCGSLGVDPEAVSRFVSAGGEHVVFFSDQQLEPGAAPDSTQSIYDRKAGESEAEVISVDPNGDPFDSDATYIGASEDGSTVIFSVGSALYAHRGGETSEVVLGSHSFAGVSEDGTQVLYTISASGDTPAELYRFEPDTEATTQIAANARFVNVTPDGSGVLFTSKGDLAPGEENENGEEATASQTNLYSWDGATTRFIAILDPNDFEAFGGDLGVDLGAWVRSVYQGQRVGRANSPTRATPDGEVFVFQSHAKLTAYDNKGVGAIYRYEPSAPEGKRLLCISCDPSGAPVGGDAMLQIYNGIGGGSALEHTLITNITDDGQTVFFQSPDQLLPEDANSVIDVYQWRAEGAGKGPEECKRASGCLALISTGQGEQRSSLYGMSADGHDVFIATREKLVGADLPGTYSLYDARVEGGIPAPPVPAPCQGDACQGQGSAAPGLTAPASTAPLSGGNVSQAPSRSCPKGKRKVRSKGKVRCVKKQAKKKRHGKKAGGGKRAGR